MNEQDEEFIKIKIGSVLLIEIPVSSNRQCYCLFHRAQGRIPKWTFYPEQRPECLRPRHSCLAIRPCMQILPMRHKGRTWSSGREPILHFPGPSPSLYESGRFRRLQKTAPGGIIANRSFRSSIAGNTHPQQLQRLVQLYRNAS